MYRPILLAASAILAATALSAQTYSVLYNFCSQPGCTDGAYPDGTLLQAADGYLYGTTAEGANISAGTLYKLSLTGDLTTIYDLCTSAGDCPQSVRPEAPLIQGTYGNLYGTTFGVAEQSGFAGAAFVVSGGKVITLHSFCSRQGCLDGENPAGLIQSIGGDLYG